MTARGVHRSGGPGDAASLSVSVLTPSFEQAAWLPDNLRSVACQTYPDVEHVVVDGGSTDGTVGLLETASAERRDGRAPGHRLLWVSETDRGQAHAINKAFARSSGQIIGWINSDDAYLDCEAIARAVAVFAARPEVDIVYGHCLQTTADGGFIQVLWAPPFDGGMLRSVNILSQPAVFIRRSALGDAMLDESFHFAMDYELWFGLKRQAGGLRDSTACSPSIAISRGGSRPRSPTCTTATLPAWPSGTILGSGRSTSGCARASTCGSGLLAPGWPSDCVRRMRFRCRRTRRRACSGGRSGRGGRVGRRSTGERGRRQRRLED